MRRISARVSRASLPPEGRVRLYASPDGGGPVGTDPVSEAQPGAAARRGPRWLEEAWLAGPLLERGGGRAAWADEPWLTGAWLEPQGWVVLPGPLVEEGLISVEAEIADAEGAVSPRSAATVYVNDSPPRPTAVDVTVTGGAIRLTVTAETV